MKDTISTVKQIQNYYVSVVTELDPEKKKERITSMGKAEAAREPETLRQ